MRWPWQRHDQLEGHPSEEATSAATEAKRGRQDLENLAGRVEDVADRLAKTRDRNHFGEAFKRALRGELT